jgi:hypothetical protein
MSTMMDTTHIVKVQRIAQTDDAIPVRAINSDISD